MDKLVNGRLKEVYISHEMKNLIQMVRVAQEDSGRDEWAIILSNRNR